MGCLCLVVAAVLAACGGDADEANTSESPTTAETQAVESEAVPSDTTPEETLPTGTGDSETLPSGETESLPEESETEKEKQLYTYPAEQAGAKSDIVLKAEDFGVVGDGKTDDGPAISAAVNAAIEQKATLVFDGSKTYYMDQSDNTAAVFRSPFAMENATAVTIDGQGATFLVAPGSNYFAMAGCSDIVLKNCSFDYAVPVYLVGKVISNDGGRIVFETDQEPYSPSATMKACSSAPMLSWALVTAQVKSS